MKGVTELTAWKPQARHVRRKSLDEDSDPRYTRVYSRCPCSLTLCNEPVALPPAPQVLVSHIACIVN